MAIARVWNTGMFDASTVAAGTAHSLAWGGTAPVGAFAMLIIHAANSSAAAPAPTTTLGQTGWTFDKSVTWGTYCKSSVYWKITGASEPATYTWTNDVGSNDIALLVAWSGVDTTTPLAVSAIAAEASAVSAHVTPSLTTTARADGVYISVFVDRSTTSTKKSTNWVVTNASPTFQVEALEQGSNTRASAPWVEQEINDNASAPGTVSSAVTVTSTSAISQAAASMYICSINAAGGGAAAAVRNKPVMANQAVFRGLTRCSKLTRRRSGLFVPAEWEKKLVVA